MDKKGAIGPFFFAAESAAPEISRRLIRALASNPVVISRNATWISVPVNFFTRVGV